GTAIRTEYQHGLAGRRTLPDRRRHLRARIDHRAGRQHRFGNRYRCGLPTSSAASPMMRKFLSVGILLLLGTPGLHGQAERGGTIAGTVLSRENGEALAGA